MKKKTQAIKRVLMSKHEAFAFDRTDALNSGLTLMNLATTGHPYRCYVRGAYGFIVGDSSSGKTFLLMTALAEAARDPKYDDYDFIYDATTEEGAQMDIARYFGQKVADRLRVIRSKTAEEMYFNLDDAFRVAREAGRKVIYLTDSENGLKSLAADKKFTENKKAFRKGKELAGSYGDGKAKIHSENIKRVCDFLRDTGSIWIVAGQTRDNIEQFSFEKTTRSGGRSLKFWAQIEYWTKVIKPIKKHVKGKDRKIGKIIQMDIRKNRFTGKEWTIKFPIYNSFGIDNVGANIDFLLEEGHWKKGAGGINATEFKFKGTRDDLARHVEAKSLEKPLIKIVTGVWREIEAGCEVNRKNRYA